MHLDAEQVTEAVWEEGRRNACPEQCLGRARRELSINEHFRQHQVCPDVQVTVVDAALYLVDDREFHAVHPVDQVLEARIAIRVSARDVGCVAVNLRAGVDQEGPRLAGRAAVKVRVVQYGAMLVQGNDVPIRQFGVYVADSRAIVSVDFEFRFAVAKRCFRGDVTRRCAARSEAHDCKFIFGF